jgi:hypothetical protein
MTNIKTIAVGKYGGNQMIYFETLDKYWRLRTFSLPQNITYYALYLSDL